MNLLGRLLVLYVLGAAAAGEGDGGGGGSLWGELVGRCGGAASYSCVQEGLGRYLEETLEGRELRLGDVAVFTRNDNKYSREANSGRSARGMGGGEGEGEPELSALVDSLEEAEGLGADPSPRTSVSGLADLLQDKAVGYLLTHDLSLALPRSLFGPATLDIRPQSIEEDGSALVRIKLNDRRDLHEPPQAEGRILFKKIKQLLKRKLLTGFLAALLIVALLKVKLLFFAPLLLGVTTAKKLLLKVLLFLFPALAHLFKLCAYYHHHHSKYHLHHHHQIAHHHHHVPVPVVHHSPSYHHEEIAYPEEPPPGPPHGGGYIGTVVGGGGPYHRSSEPAPPPTAGENELTSWGIEAPPLAAPHYAAPDQSNDLARVWQPPPNKKKMQVEVLGTEWDPFYSPILSSVDEVFNSLGFQAEGCRERLVCSMYKAPHRFSPHSNLISNQLSRDPAELERPAYSNSAVGRFYRYVEAARDGQGGKDCLSLYPTCAVVTE